MRRVSAGFRGASLSTGRGVLGDRLGSLRNGVSGQFSRKKEAHGSLDFTGRNRGALVHLGEADSKVVFDFE